MSDIKPSPPQAVFKIGPDRVTINGDEVVIEAKREMPEWQVREFKVIPIYFQENKYYLVQKKKIEKPYAMRYVLLPWVDGRFDSAKFSFSYDEEAVAERDANCKGEKRAELTHAAMLPLFPFLGFLWSGTQNRLASLGFVPRTITTVSIWLSFLAAFCELVFACISINASARTGHMMLGGLLSMLLPWSGIRLGVVTIAMGWLDVVLFATLSVDATMRITYAARDDQWCGGLLEWIFRKRIRANF